jgi:hypothetical protein
MTDDAEEIAEPEEDEEQRDDLRRCPLCVDGYSYDGKRICPNCKGSNVVKA